ncbi:C40 family peptidase [Paenibacillus lentus]|uniref:C40 family peptidase n=1 Tax=Paenibacillus lentus TaxID=1338368 RepID=UPI003661015A
MSIKVDPKKVDELSAQTKRFGDFVEREERNVYQSISQLVRETQSQYPELYGRSELNEIERLLKEIRKQAEGITGGLRDKAKVLTEAAARYRKDEETAKTSAKKKYEPVPPSSYYSANGGLFGKGLTSYLQDALFQDPVVQKLHQLALHGTEKEKKEAKEKLDAIFKARNTIARAQVAYSVYKAFGNTYLMEQAHKEAMKQRGILKGYGISEELYGEKVNISEYFKGSPLEACSYDPSMQIVKDGKFVQVLMPEDNQYQYLLGLVMKGGAQGAWAQKQLDEIHKQLGEIGRAQVAWHEYKAKGMTKEMDGAHAYAEKIRGILKDKYALSSAMVDGVIYKHLWTGTGPAGNYLNVKEKEKEKEKENVATKPPGNLNLSKLKETNAKIKDIKGNNQKIKAIYERNQWLVPYITRDTSNKPVMSSLEMFQKHYTKNKEKYERVSKKTGVPPELIAAIHWRESSGDFSRYLHNGDPLGKKTVNVPKGIFFTDWEEAAIHALNQKKSIRDGVGIDSTSKDIAKMMTFAEYYNGLGYINHKVNSVYVFSGSNIPLEGKYYKDGVFTYGPVVDKNPGVAVMLQSILDLPKQESPQTIPSVPPANSGSTNVSKKGTEGARETVLELAKQFEGKVPYYMDGNRPKYMDPESPPKAMDCSDFTSAIYRTILRDLGVGDNIDIGANTRTQIHSGLEVWTAGKKDAGSFDTANLKKGDLILFTSPNSSQVGHVGIYLGDGKFIHESGSNAKGGNVKISDLKGYWLKTQKPISVRRIIGDDGNVYSQNGKKVGSIK